MMKRFELKFEYSFALKVFLFFIVFLFNFQQARSEGKNNAKEDLTKIKSNIIDIKRKLQIMDFLGNVVVEKQDSSMLADKMRVFYEENKKSKKENNFDTLNQTSSKMEQSSIKRIDAVGNVKIFTEEYIAKGDFGYYEPNNNIFVLEKNVTVNNGTSVASGDKFIYDITTKKGNFIGKKDKIVSKDNTNVGDSRVVIVIGNDLKDQRQKNKNND